MALTEPKTIQLGDKILMDVRPNDEWVQVRVLAGNTEHKAMVKKVDLWGAVFMMMDDKKMQDDLMPVRQTQMMTFEKIHVVRVKKDLRKGDILKFVCKTDVPLTIVESLKGMLPNEKASPILL